MKLLAVDGNSILNRAFYGIRLLSAKDGTYTNGIYGFLTILLRMTEEVSPDAVAITFDMRAPTFRHKLYTEYKAQRKGMPQELAVQMPLLIELLEYLGYPIVRLEGFEADDLLGTLSLSACESGHKCVIATGDRDSFQLIDDCTTVRLASTKAGKPVAEIYDAAAINERYGVTPAQLIDVKALMGDASDNIPGVAGVGEKTALSLIQTHGSLEKMYAGLDALDIRASLREKLSADKEMALLSYDLAKIHRHAPIDTDISSYIPKEKDHAAAHKLMVWLELFSLMEKFGISAADNKSSDTAKEEEIVIEINYNTPLDEVLAEVSTIDMLTDNAGETVYIAGKSRVYVYDIHADSALGKILESPMPKRVHGSKQFYRFAFENGIQPDNITFDTEIAAYILNPTSGSYDLPRLMAEYGIGVPDIPFDPDGISRFCAAFPALAETLAAKLRDNNQYKLFSKIEMPLAEVLASMEQVGIELDVEGLCEYGGELDNEIAQTSAEIFRLAGEEFNINSPKQLGVILFEKLGLPHGKKTKTGWSTSADVLDMLRGKHEIINAISKFRQASKLKSTYVDGLLNQVGGDARVHTTFQQTLTRTGRISSVEPNMQNIPVKTAMGSEIRLFFRAEKGKILLDADYSQIELRVLAHIADDENMISAFKNNEDIHLNTAAQVFDLPPVMVTPVMRSRAKAVNFGIVYGIGAFSLAQDIGVSVAEANRYIKSYLETYSGVRAYMDETVEFGQIRLC